MKLKLKLKPIKSIKIIFIIGFCAVFFFLSCLQKPKDRADEIKLGDEKVLRKVYSNGNLVKEQEFLKYNDDSFVADGYYKEYYQNGSISVVRQFKNGKKNGQVVSYFKNGHLDYVNYYKNGIIDSFALSFYENGDTMVKYFYLDGLKWAKQIEYDSFGEINNIVFYTHDGRALFNILLHNNETAQCNSKPIYFESNSNPVKVGQKFVMVNHVIETDNIRTVLKISLVTSLGKLLKDTTVNTYDYYLNSNFNFYTYTFNNKGIYNYNVDIKLLEKKSGKIIRKDTAQIKIEVR